MVPSCTARAETRRIAEFAHGDAAGFDLRHTARADQHIRLHRTDGHRQQPQVSGAIAPDQRARDFHRRRRRLPFGTPISAPFRDTAGDFIGGDIAFRGYVHGAYSAAI